MKRCLGFERDEILGFLKMEMRFVEEESVEEKESVVAILVDWFVQFSWVLEIMYKYVRVLACVCG